MNKEQAKFLIAIVIAVSLLIFAIFFPMTFIYSLLGVGLITLILFIQSFYKMLGDR